MAKPLFIAIGVHKANTMPVLDGVLTSVKSLADWASNCGYDVIQIDDRFDKVTVRRIRMLLTPDDIETGDSNPRLLLDRPRVVVYFCGHGLHAPQDQYWILSAGPDQPDQRISAVGFRDMLATYGPKQLSIISDACRSPLAVRGLASSVVDSNPSLGSAREKDNFFSSQDGEASFAMPASGATPGYCIFSKVLLEALSAPGDPAAFDLLYMKLGRQIVSSQSLATFLEQKVPNAALHVGKLQTPQCDPGFRPLANDYAEFAKISSVALESHEDIDARQNDLEQVRSQAQEKRIRDSRSEWRRPFVEMIQPTMAEALEAPNKYSPLLMINRRTQYEIVVSTKSRRPFPALRLHRLPEEIRKLSLMVTPISGFADSGLSSTAVVSVGRLYAAIPLHRNLWCAVLIEEIEENDRSLQQHGGVELLAWGSVFFPPPHELTAAEALKGLSAGTLNAEDAAIIAADIRVGKHIDPMYGIVSAYLYNAIGDVSNIRRMCYYYDYYGQDVPFDIAMLAHLPLQERSDGGFRVEVPAVPQTPRQHRVKGGPNFTWESTPKHSVNVAGVIPLLRAGWQHMQASRHAVHRKSMELAPDLTDSPIATLRGHTAGHRLIQILEEL